MERISRENIEEYILDYIEGNLDRELHERINEFLRLNPDIEKDIIDLDLAYIRPPEIKYPDKSSLHATESISNFEHRCILAIEDQLNEGEKKSFTSEILANKTKMEVMNNYRNTISSPDKTIVFPEKESLKHNIGYKSGKIIQYASAAAIMLLITVSSLLMKDQRREQRNIIESYSPVASVTKLEKAIENPKQKPAKKISIESKKEIKPYTPGEIIANNKKITKTEIIKTKTNPAILLVSSSRNYSEPEEIILPEERYLLADQREFCLNGKAREWTEKSKLKKRKKGHNINTISFFGESTLKTIFSKFINTTKISHERTIYMAESKMD